MDIVSVAPPVVMGTYIVDGSDATYHRSQGFIWGGDQGIFPPGSEWEKISIARVLIMVLN